MPGRYRVARTVTWRLDERRLRRNAPTGSTSPVLTGNLRGCRTASWSGLSVSALPTRAQPVSSFGDATRCACVQSEAREGTTTPKYGALPVSTCRYWDHRTGGGGTMRIHRSPETGHPRLLLCDTEVCPPGRETHRTTAGAGGPSRGRGTFRPTDFTGRPGFVGSLRGGCHGSPAQHGTGPHRGRGWRCGCRTIGGLPR